MSSASAQTTQTLEKRSERKLSLRTRLHAWWEGDDLPEGEEAPAAADSPPEPETLVIETGPDDPVWSEERTEIAELIWGDESTEPAGTARVVDMVRPMGLDSSKTLLDLSAGLGAAARVIAKDSGAWVTGMEPSPTLANQAMARSSAAGLNRKAPVQHYDPETLELPPRTFDAVVAKEVFFTTRNKEQLFATITEALKTGGQIVFTDYLLREPGLETDPAVLAWAESEPKRPTLWSVEEVVHYLRSIGLDVRVTEDVTDEYRAQVVAGMAALQARRKDIHKLDRDAAELLIDEAEHWARRVAVLDTGCVRVYRIYARKPEMGGPARTLSDW